MKTKQEQNTSTGLAVRTTLKAGEDYVTCGCAPVKNAGWQCDDGKGNSEMVWSEPALWSWMDTYCERPKIHEMPEMPERFKKPTVP